MSVISWGVDWVTLTKKKVWQGQTTITKRGDLMAAMLTEALELGFDVNSYEVVQGNRFYDVAIKFKDTGLVLSGSFKIEHQGMMIVMSGKCGGSSDYKVDVMRDALEAGWDATRVDVAIDVVDTLTRVADWHECYMSLHGDNVQRKTQFIRSPRGDTFYVGSRKSTKYLRIYDKGGEQGVDHDWVRLELECKAEIAQQVARVACKDMASAARVLMDWLDLTPYAMASEILDALSGQQVMFVHPVRNQDGHHLWLYRTVAKTLARMMAFEPNEYATLLDYVAQLANVEKNEPRWSDFEN